MSVCFRKVGKCTTVLTYSCSDTMGENICTGWDMYIAVLYTYQCTYTAYTNSSSNRYYALYRFCYCSNAYHVTVVTCSRSTIVSNRLHQETRRYENVGSKMGSMYLVTFPVRKSIPLTLYLLLILPHFKHPSY